MCNLRFNVFLSCALAAALVSRAAGRSTLVFANPGEPQPKAVASPIQIQAKTDRSVSFESQATSCTVDAVRLADGDYSVLELPGGGRFGEVGEPQLPCYGRFVEVPAGAAVRLVIDNVEWVAFKGEYKVAPRQEPPTDKAGEPAPPYRKSQDAYAKNAFTPTQPVQLGEPIRVRGKTLVYVTYLPMAYNPGQSALKAARRVRWHLEYDAQQGKGAAAPAQVDDAGTQGFAPFFEGVLDASPAGQVPASPVLLAGADSTTNGADYLIIAADLFYTNVLPLAQWKHAKGYRTRVVRTSEISATPTCTNITAFIGNAYSNWVPSPAYVLIVGDAEYIPAWYKTTHSYYGSTAKAGTDLYYSTVDGTDYFPDLFLGRLPCSTTAQCDLMVNKILMVERTPDALASSYQTVLTAGEYTDSGGGYEERIFIETAEAVRDYHVAKGHTVPTSYCSDTATTPRHYNASESLLHINGSLYGGAQTYLSTAGGTAAISNAINAGVWLVQHRDHGSQTGGWATPPWSPSRAYQLGNGSRLPVVMSINCETAWFDGGGTDSLAEGFLKNPNGGAYAVIGATRVSYSWHNDWFTHGLYECLYPDYFETLSGISYYKPGLTYGGNYAGHGTHLGQMLNFAKILMYEKEGAGSTTQIEFDILTLLGDPEQSPRNAVPRTLTVTHPVRLDALIPASFTVAVSSQGSPVAGALVALVLDPGDYHTAVTDASGLAPFAFTPRMPEGGTNGFMSVTVSEQNAIPYQGTARVTPKGFTVTLPARATEGAGQLVGLGRVRVTPTPETDLTVSLSCGDTSEATVPESVVIPAGQTNASFTVTVVDDAALDGTQMAVITASAPDYASGEQSLAIDDNEAATLAVSLPASAAEGEGTLVGQVSVSVPVQANVSVGLTSSYPLELSVPATVVIPSGQTSAAFVAAIVDDSLIDGPRAVTVSAHVQNWADGAAGVTVSDNETTNLTVSLPRSVLEGQGVITNAGRVSLSGLWPAAITVSLLNSDATELSVPASVVIPSGQSNVSFNVTVVDDTALDGVQSVSVRASSGGFVDGLATASVFDNDLHHFTWGSIASPQRAGSAFRAALSAQDLNGVTISNYAGSIIVSGSGDHGAVAVARSGEGAFADGTWSGDLAVNTPDTSVRLTANDGAGRTGVSVPFTVTVGALHHFSWSGVASPQYVGLPFGAAFTAKDVVNNTVADYTGSVSVAAVEGGAGAFNVLSGTNAWNYPMATWYHDARLQSIYLSSELGGSKRLNGLSLYVSGLPGQTMNTWTIRMKHTALSSCASGSWETNGWTVVVQTNLTMTATGWRNFAFQAPFLYNSASNLMIDFSFDNSYYTSDGACWASSVSATRSLYYRTDSYYGSPLLWTGTSPSSYSIAMVPTLRLFSGSALPVTPSNVVSFTGGSWSGAVTVLASATNVSLYASDGVGHAGESTMFKVEYLGVLSVSAPASVSESAGTLVGQGTLTLSGAAPTNDVAFSLASSDTTELEVPGSVTFPVGQSAVSFDLTARDDADLDGPQAVTLTASAPGYATAKTSVSVQDDESAALSLLLPDAVAEGDGTVAASVLASAPPASAIAVRLVSSDLTEARVPATVFLQAGQTSTVFTVEIVDDTAIDGPQAVTITAQVDNWTDAPAGITVRDNENTNLVLVLPAGMCEGQGVLTNAGQVRLSGTWPTAVTVSLLSSAPSELGVPASVVIPAGQTTALFSLAIADDVLFDGRQTYTVSASAEGFAGASVMAVVADNELHRFGWSAIASPQRAGTPFGVTVSAQDIAGATISNYAGAVSLTGVGAGGPVAFAPSACGAFSNGQWSASLAVATIDTNVRLTAADGFGHSGTSLPFTVIGGVLHHFTLSDVPSPQGAGLPFALTVEARDAAGNRMLDYADTVRLGVLREGALRDGVRISEMYVGTPDAVEFVNVTGSAVDISRWQVFIYDTSSATSPLPAFTIPDGSVCAANGVFRLTESGTAPGAYPLFYTSSNINWVAGSFTCGVLLRNAAGGVVDFVAAGSLIPTAISSPVSVVPAHWQGGQVAGVSADTSSYQRIGSLDTDTSGDWTGAASSVGTLNAGLLLPFGGGTVQVLLAPTNTGAFVSGVWTGAVSVLEAVSNVCLYAQSAQGASGTGNVFTVSANADLSISLRDSPDPVNAGDSLTYTVCVSNAGPHTIIDVRVSNLLAAAVGFVSASPSQGTCARVGGSVLWSAGTITNGRSATATIVVKSMVAGVLTNMAEVTADVYDQNLADNRAVALTTVFGTGVLRVTPAAAFNATGVVGGPFSPSSGMYILTNSGTDTLTWQASRESGWLDLSASGGVLPAHSSVPVVLSLGSGAATLPKGTYRDVVSFTNLTTSLGSAEREVDLTILGGGLLQTVFASDNSFAGNMFDLAPKKNLEIAALDVNVSPAGQAVRVTVCFRDGGSSGHENSAAGWQVLGVRTVTAAGRDEPTWVDLGGNGVELSRGRTYGLYVYVDYESGSRMHYTEGAGAVENADLRLASNCGKGNPPFTGGTYAPRQWNGGLYYDTEGLNDLRVDPADEVAFQGLEGGPFLPVGQPFTVVNSGPDALAWQAEGLDGWVSVVPAGGSLAAGASNSVSVVPTAAAGALAAGAYQSGVVFSNTASGFAVTRAVALTVLERELALSLPASGAEGQVFTNGGAVRISGALATNLTVRLSTSDTNELCLPPQAVILAGQTSASFDAGLVCDGEADGDRVVRAFASAAGFATGVAALTVLDQAAGTNAAVLSAFGLDADPGWAREGQWQFGRPAGRGGAELGNPDPTGGYTGQNVFGVNLQGDYSTAPGGPYFLTAGPFDFTSYRQVSVRFRRWLNTDVDPYVRVAVEVSTNRAAWSVVWSNSLRDIYDGQWTPVECRLPEADGAAAVYVRWGYAVGAEAWAASGWNLDDIAFAGVRSDGPFTVRGTPVAWLQRHGLTNAHWEVEEALDGDSDGKTAWEEYVCDTDPTNRDSVLALTGVLLGSGGAVVQWKGGVLATQYLERKASLVPPEAPWLAVYTNLPPTGLTGSVIDPDGTNAMRFYRVRAVR